MLQHLAEGFAILWNSTPKYLSPATTFNALPLNFIWELLYIRLIQKQRLSDRNSFTEEA